MGLVILGIDPGTVNTGYGAISVEGDQISCLGCGALSAPAKLALPARVQLIHKGLRELFKKFQPDHAAAEKVFFGKNPEAAFRLGHIFALCILESERHGSEFFEYASRFVKQTVTCSGRASKDLVRRFVANKLSLPEGPEGNAGLDATDALAVALCHSRELKRLQLQSQLQAQRQKEIPANQSGPQAF